MHIYIGKVDGFINPSTHTHARQKYRSVQPEKVSLSTSEMFIV